ncbi:putative SERF-like protein [Pseudolycoriella hygida]|uniref:SERF-like protein n=1 Tax=Pseudolycoriella hygida TaxID=35572 RepID=A0A9Q0MYS7_9DIPT|nr:putative SERF-like protein [Pseudolycoriella hygida]
MRYFENEYPNSLNMTRGNQRDLARAKNQKKLSEMKKGVRSDNLTVEQRKARDAELMREKQKKKDEEAAAKAAGK